jgi:hypothetical protein
MRVKDIYNSEITGQKYRSKQQLSADLERILYTGLYPATRIDLADLLVFYQPWNK